MLCPWDITWKDKKNFTKLFIQNFRMFNSHHMEVITGVPERSSDPASLVAPVMLVMLIQIWRFKDWEIDDNMKMSLILIITYCPKNLLIYWLLVCKTPLSTLLAFILATYNWWRMAEAKPPREIHWSFRRKTGNPSQLWSELNVPATWGFELTTSV